MTSIWQMKSPQIIISIITGVTNFKNWKNQKLEEQFRRGLIKAANKTEMWFITNGINGGISAMVGEAFNEERVFIFIIVFLNYKIQPMIKLKMSGLDTFSLKRGYLLFS
jgi:hypothetical protein